MTALLAVSDLHVRYRENQRFVDAVRPEADDDWLIVAGDVHEHVEETVGTLRALAARFAKVIWAPGNHELWTLPDDPDSSRGAVRYTRLVEALREVEVVTPEDEFSVWLTDDGQPITVAPLFVLYDYSFRPVGTTTKADALAAAQAAGVVCTDEAMLHPDPYPTLDAWCAARLDYTRQRLDQLPVDARTVLINHWPLVREPTHVLTHPEFALWCGTEHTQGWPTRYRAVAVVYGHLHIPRTIEVDGVPHHEVSLGYPREWDREGALPRRVVTVLEKTAR